MSVRVKVQISHRHKTLIETSLNSLMSIKISKLFQIKYLVMAEARQGQLSLNTHRKINWLIEQLGELKRNHYNIVIVSKRILVTYSTQIKQHHTRRNIRK
jgi:hypothetical protein